MLRLIIILSGLFCGCGTIDQLADFTGDTVTINRRGETIKYTIDDELKPYVNLFEKLHGQEVNMGINFGYTGSTAIGVCITYTISGRVTKREIRIDSEYWETASENERMVLMFHELGHCVLNRRHDIKTGIVGEYDDVPLSIMWPFNIGNHLSYRDNKTYYLNELLDYP